MYLPDVISKNSEITPGKSCMLGASSQHEMDTHKEVEEHVQVVIHSMGLDFTFLNGLGDLGETDHINGTPIGKWSEINAHLSDFVEFVIKECCISTAGIGKVTGVLIQHTILFKVQEQSLQ